MQAWQRRYPNAPVTEAPIASSSPGTEPGVVGSWWVYVLRCADDTFYVGIARDVMARVRIHNTDDRRGAKYTRGRRPIVLHAAHPCADRSAATRLERQVKRWERARKAELSGAPGWLASIDFDNPG